MKHTFTLATACIIACILLSSCGSNTSIAKRHYNKGFYVNWNKRKPNTIVAKTEPKLTQTTKRMPVISAPAIESNSGEHFNSNIQSSSIIITNKALRYKTVSEPVTEQLLNQNVANSGAPVLENKQTMSEAGDHDDGGGRGAALSLLWLIIVVILILWLIGILAGGFGLGGLVNVLLVIALVLLVLWLLRIL